MEKFTKIPGLQRISEDIFELLDKKSLMDCRLVNSSWKNVLEQPIFWLKKMNLENVPMNVHQSWKNLAQQLEDGHPKKEFVLTLIKIYKKTERITPMEIVSDLCMSDLVMFVLGHPNKKVVGHITPIDLAEIYGLTEVVEVLKKKYFSPNLKVELDGYGRTPIFFVLFKFGEVLA